MKTVVSMLLGAYCLGLTAAYSATVQVPANPYSAKLSAVPAGEMPAKAAEVVKAASAKQREATTVSVVKAAVGLNPAAAPSIVGAISRSVPEMAPTAAATAAAEQPAMAVAVARAASAAAREQTRRIVAAVCRAVPNQYREVANGVSETVIGANREILEGVSDSLPEYRDSINSNLGLFANHSPSVMGVLNAAQPVAAVSGTAGAGSAPSFSLISSAGPAVAPVGGGAMARGPAVGPPFIPLTGSPTNVVPGTGGEVPTGGRNYAAP